MTVTGPKICLMSLTIKIMDKEGIEKLMRNRTKEIIKLSNKNRLSIYDVHTALIEIANAATKLAVSDVITSLNITSDCII